MRILLIAEVFLPKVDGVVIRTMNLIRHLQEKGDEILVVCPQVDGSRDSPVPVAEFPSFPFPAYPEYRIGMPDRRLVKVLDEFSPDLVHYINPFAFGFRCYDILAMANRRPPTIFSFHTLYGEFVKQYALTKPLSRILWWLTRDYHNTADKNLTVSTIIQRDLTLRGFERVELWPPAVDCELFNPGRSDVAMRQRLSAGAPDRPLLLTVSRLAPEKNVGFLAEVVRQIPEVRLAVIGDGPERAALERRFAGTNTAFFGYMRGVDLARAYASSDAFMYASETETMGNVVLEAMASGLGVVAPQAGGIPSLISQNETGLLYRPGDTQAAVAALRSLLSGEARVRIGHSARAAVEQWGWNRSVECVRRHYIEAVEACQQGRRAALRTRHLGPAMVRSLVLAYRALSLAAPRGKTPGDRSVVRLVGVGEPYLNSHGGFNGPRPKGAGT